MDNEPHVQPFVNPYAGQLVLISAPLTVVMVIYCSEPEEE